MSGAFQKGAFQSPGFQVQDSSIIIGDSVDLDKGGNLESQVIEVWLGPSLGQHNQQVRPTLTITSVGNYVVGAASTIIVAVTLPPVETSLISGVNSLVSGTNMLVANLQAQSTTVPVSLQLQSVKNWMQQQGDQPRTHFDKSVWVKLLGRQVCPIIAVPFGNETIDGQPSVSLSPSLTVVRIYPLNDLSGWFLG